MRGRIRRKRRVLEIIQLLYPVGRRDPLRAAMSDALRAALPFSSGVLLPIDRAMLELRGVRSPLPAGKHGALSGALRGLRPLRPADSGSLLTGLAAQDESVVGEVVAERAASRAARDWADRAERNDGGEVTRWNARLTIVTVKPSRQREDVRRRLGCDGLSPRELEIRAPSVLRAPTSAELADPLRISKDTLKSHLQAAFHRMGGEAESSFWSGYSV